MSGLLLSFNLSVCEIFTYFNDRENIASMKEKDLLSQIDKLTEMIIENPTKGDYYYNRGNLYKTLSQYDKSLADYNEAIRLNPTDGNYYNGRGNLYQTLSQYDKSLADYNEAIRLNPTDGNYYNGRGSLYQTLSQYDKSLADYNEAIRLNPTDGDYYYNRGILYQTLSQYDKSLADYNEAIRLNPTDGDYYNGRGNLYDTLSQYDKSLADYNEAIRLNPTKGDYYNNRGILYDTLSQYDKSLADYNEAIRLNPTKGDYYYNRGILYKTLSQYSEAQTDFNAYLYFCIIQNKRIKKLSTLISFYEAKPKTVKTILEFSDISATTLLFGSIVRPLMLIEDFVLLLEYYQETISNYRKLLNAQAILSLYLMDDVSSFIIFDDKLDTGEYTLCSQELYYYSLTAHCLGREADIITITNIESILEKESKSDLDYYYLGHLYLLQGDRNQSLENFTKSDNFIFSSLMLSYLLEDRNKCKELIQVVNFDNVYNSPQIIDYENMDLSQFQHFFYTKECTEALNFYSNTSAENENLGGYHKHLWEIFKLSSHDRITLGDEINRIRIEPLLGKLQLEFSKALSSGIDSKKEYFMDKIYASLKERDADTRDKFQHLRIALNESRDTENQLGLDIERLGAKDCKISPKFYLHLIQYYYLQGKINSENIMINSEEVFTLYFYLIYTVKKREKLADDFLSELSENVATYIGIPLLLSLSKFVWSVISSQYDDFIVTEDYSSDFKVFKKNLWRYISNDKDSLTEEAFEKKYSYYNWFDNKQNSINTSVF